MNENNTKSDEWFEKGKRDLEAAGLILRYRGHPDPAAMLLQQAMEKYLKGFLIGKGWKLVKTHNLKYLLDECIKHNPEFGRYYDLGIKLTKYYIDEKYPPMTTEITLEEAQALHAQVEELLKFIKH